MSQINCGLCENQLHSGEYNLNESKTVHSNTLLVNFIHNCIDNNFYTFNNLNNNICKICYDLLNELDNIEIRANTIRTHFREYFNNKLQNNFQCKLENNDNLIIIETLLRNEESASQQQQQEINILKTNTINKSLESKKQFETCTVCLKRFSSNKIKNHMETEHSHSIEYVNNLIEIKDELQTENNEKELKTELLKCNLCSKTWKTNGELKAHLLTHKTDRPFICEICGQAYKREAALAIHVGMHKGVSPFTCVYCNKSFTQKIALVRHMPIHTGELRYQCDMCGRRFIHRTSFNMHRLSHTGQKSYKCDVCGLALMSCSHLKRHMRVHTGEKNYCCKVCGKRFAEKYNLVAHEKLHSNSNCSSTNSKKKFRCQICDNTFDRKIKLEEHLTTDHQKIKMENELIQSDFLEIYNINT